LLNTTLVLLLHFVDAMGCDPDRYQDSILNAEGRVWPLPCHFMQYCPYFTATAFLQPSVATGIADSYSGCSEYANDLPVIVDEDGNYYGRFPVANSLASRFRFWKIPLHPPATARPI
jgi:hypothetical protein